MGAKPSGASFLSASSIVIALFVAVCLNLICILTPVLRPFYLAYFIYCWLDKTPWRVWQFDLIHSCALGWEKRYSVCHLARPDGWDPKVLGVFPPEAGQGHKRSVQDRSASLCHSPARCSGMNRRHPIQLAARE